MEIDPRQPLSPEQIAVLAVVVHPELRAARDQRRIVRAQLLQAELLPNPQLSAGLEFPYHSSPPDDSTAYNLGLDWEVTALIGRDERRRAAAANVASVDLQIAWKEWQTAQAAKIAAYDVLALNEQLEGLRELEKQITAALELLRRAVDAHEKTMTDLAGAAAAAVDTHQMVITADVDRRVAVIALNRAVGLPADTKLILRRDELPSRIATPTTAALIGDLEGRRLDLLALKRGYESEDATLRAAILGQFPKINVGFTAARDTSDVKTIGLGATIDIPLFDHNQGVIASETATRQKLFDEYATRVFEARSDVARAVVNIQGVNDQLAAAEASLPALERLMKTYESAQQRGDVDALSLYSAHNAVLQKKVDVAKLKQELMQNWVALEIASGQFLTRERARSTTQAAEEPR